jgi:hypothetical protein
LVIATQLGWHDLPSIALAIVLAFVFGHALTPRALLTSGVAFGRAMRLAFAAVTLSITVMEIVDNAVILAIPGAMAAGIGDPLLWGTPSLGLAIAGVVAYPVNPLADQARWWPRGPPRAPLSPAPGRDARPHRHAAPFRAASRYRPR